MTLREFWRTSLLSVVGREHRAYLYGVYLRHAKPRDLGWWER